MDELNGLDTLQPGIMNVFFDKKCVAGITKKMHP